MTAITENNRFRSPRNTSGDNEVEAVGGFEKVPFRFFDDLPESYREMLSGARVLFREVRENCVVITVVDGATHDYVFGQELWLTFENRLQLKQFREAITARASEIVSVAQFDAYVKNIALPEPEPSAAEKVYDAIATLLQSRNVSFAELNKSEICAAIEPVLPAGPARC